MNPSAEHVASAESIIRALELREEHHRTPWAIERNREQVAAMLSPLPPMNDPTDASEQLRRQRRPWMCTVEYQAWIKKYTEYNPDGTVYMGIGTRLDGMY